ncbi:MAG: hypothetical protein WKF73_16605 [Nocardioidaceae bacterium]
MIRRVAAEAHTAKSAFRESRNESRSSSTSGVITPKSSAQNGKSPMAFFSALKSSLPGTFDPVSVDCRFIAARNFPRRRKAAKMVNAHDVNRFQSRFHAVNPPAENRRARIFSQS